MRSSVREDGNESGPEPSRYLSRTLLQAAGAVLLIFVLYEVAERLWLADTDPGVLHVLRMARAIVASTVAAVLVGWSIARSSPPLLATSPSEEEWVRGDRPTEDSRAANYARWMVRMRWIAVVVALALVFISIWAARLLPSALAVPLTLTLAALAALNIAYTILLESGFRRRMLLHIQVYVDLVALTVLLHFSGGIENPLALIMLFHVIIGGIVLSRTQCYLVAAAGSALLGLLALAEWSHVLDHYTLEIFPHFGEEDIPHHAAHEPLYVLAWVGLQAVVLFVTAYFVSTLVDRLRHEEGQLETMANRALAEGQLLERSLETTGAALRVVDADLQSRWTNSRWRSWFGSVEPGSPPARALQGEGSAVFRTLRDGRIRHTALTLDRPRAPHGADARDTDSRRTYQVTTAALRDAHGHISQVVQLARDVTEQRRSQVRMIRAGQLAAVGELAGQVAHEVNNPIAIISAKARLLLADHRNEMSEEASREVGKIVDLSDRVAQIAGGLLSSCRPSGALRAPLEVGVPIRRALAMVEARARSLGVRIDQHLAEQVPLVRANDQEMEQVALNLFLNALDAMPQGGRLTVSARRARVSPDKGESVVITVQDTGPGIPKALRQRVFEPFFTTKAAGRGTGLGLSICQGLVRSHGGRIVLDSRRDGGCRFIVILPAEERARLQGVSHG
jgi:signal transduction histidine kinase